MNAVAELISSIHVGASKRVACPDCSYERKKSNEKDLVIHEKSDGWTYYCHHCMSSGFVPFQKTNHRKIDICYPSERSW